MNNYQLFIICYLLFIVYYLSGVGFCAVFIAFFVSFYYNVIIYDLILIIYQELDSARCSSHSLSRFITTSLLAGHSTFSSPLSQCASHGRSAYHHHHHHHHHDHYHVQMMRMVRSWKIKFMLIILNDDSKYFNKTIFWRKSVIMNL